jgi:hypothetical protein
MAVAPASSRKRFLMVVMSSLLVSVFGTNAVPVLAAQHCQNIRQPLAKG